MSSLRKKSQLQLKNDYSLMKDQSNNKKISLGHQIGRSQITHTPAKGTGKSHKKDRQNWKNQIKKGWE